MNGIALAGGGALLRFAGSLLSPGGSRARLAILIYHRMLRQPDPLLPGEIDAATFEGQMALLAAHFNALPLSEACERLGRGGLPARAVCVTFDDGYSDNEQVALPILRRYGVPATFFVSTGYLDGGAMFNDAVIELVRAAPAGSYELAALGLDHIDVGDAATRRSAARKVIGRLKYRRVSERNDLVQRLAEALRAPLPRNLMMTPAQIRRLHAAGMEIGGHTVSHPILATLQEEEARVEITAGKRTLEEITGARVALFAYPNGKPGVDYGPQHVRLVREAGFAAAVSARGGVAHRDSLRFELPRISPWEKSPLRLGARLVASCARPVQAPA